MKSFLLLLSCLLLSSFTNAHAAENLWAILPDSDTAAWRTLATDWLQSAGEKTPRVVTATEALKSTAPTSARAIVFGHAGNNALLARWYARGLVSTDMQYPGADGWELRWLPGTDEAGPSLVVGATSPTVLSTAKIAFLEAVKEPVPHTRVQLAQQWRDLDAQYATRFAPLQALPKLGDRVSKEKMIAFTGDQYEVLVKPEELTWPIWIRRMVELAIQLGEWHHATQNPQAATLYKKALSEIIDHIPPAETFEAGQKDGKEWMWEYTWPVFATGLMLNQGLFEHDTNFSQRLNHALYETIRIYNDNSIYKAALINSAEKKGIFGSRHEVGCIYGIYVTAQFLEQANNLTPEERVTVQTWLKGSDDYFAMADAGPSADDNAMNNDDIDTIATYWIDKGRVAAINAGGVEWAARFLIGHTDNWGRVASWGYEYDAPTFSHLVIPLRKVAYFGARQDWLDWSKTYQSSGTQNFILRRSGPWGVMRNYEWGEKVTPQSTTTVPSFITGLQVLKMPPARAAAINDKAPDSVYYSISARTGTAKTDALAVMMATNGLYWNNAVAGALVHFYSHGENWLRGSFVDSYLAVGHNRAFVSGSAAAEAVHNVELVWQREEADWMGWGIREKQDNGTTWSRDVVLWKRGSLLVKDRVTPTDNDKAPWLTTWIPLTMPQREGDGWRIRQGQASLWIIGDDSQELRLEAQGRTLGNDPIPAEPWLLRSVARTTSTNATNDTRWTLLAVGPDTSTAPKLQTTGTSCSIRLPGEEQNWIIQQGEQGLAVKTTVEAPARAPDKTAPVAQAPVSTDGGNKPITVEPAQGGKIFEQPDREALLLEQPQIDLRAGAASTITLPGAAQLSRVIISTRGPKAQDAKVEWIRNGETVETLSTTLNQPKPLNEWKGYAVDYATGEVATTKPVTADAIRVTTSAGGRSQVRLFGQAIPPLQGTLWKSLTLWPQADAAPWAVCLDQRSRLTVVDAKGAVQWRHEGKPQDITAVAASRTAPPRLAVLSSDERVRVFDEKGQLLWTTSLHEATPTAFGNVPFRALWHDCNGDNIDDLLVGQFCFETALDGRDGKLLGQSEFIPLFWPQALAISQQSTGPRLWTAPSVSSSLKVWDIKANDTRYFQSTTARPTHGGNTIFFDIIGNGSTQKLVQVRENMVWMLDPQIPFKMPGQYQNLEDNVDWLWRPPAPLVAGTASSTGENLVGDLMGRLYLLDTSGHVVQQTTLPTSAVRISALPSPSGNRWSIIGSNGHSWMLDKNLKISLVDQSDDQLHQNAGDVWQHENTVWHLMARGNQVELLSMKVKE